MRWRPDAGLRAPRTCEHCGREYRARELGQTLRGRAVLATGCPHCGHDPNAAPPEGHDE